MNRKILLFSIAFLLNFSILKAQAPAEGVNYQAVARDAAGNVITTPITVRIGLLANSPGGTLVYQETHNVTPNQFGLFTIAIGQGTVSGGTAGSFSNIDWSTGAYFAKTEINTGASFINMGTTQLWSVPYALYSKRAANADNAGNVNITGTNGIVVNGSGGNFTISQNLNLNNLSDVNTAGASNGNVLQFNGSQWVPATVTGGGTLNAGPGITIGGSTISALDTDPTNEIQNLSLAGNQLSISNGNTVTLPAGTTYTAGSGISIAGNVISATDNSATNEIQTLTLAGNTLSISGGNSVTLSTGGGTLDQAYDFGGAGAGRTITADAGSVTINGPATNTGNPGISLLVTQAGTSTAAIGAQITGTGNAINAANTNAANSLATIQSTTNSATLNNSAIFGQSTGTARAVTGEITSTATSDVAVRGNNLRTTGGIGVEGVGVNGVSGVANNNQGFGVFGNNTAIPNPATGTNNAVGVAGLGGIGVNGQTTNGQLVGVYGQNLNTGIINNNIGVLGSSNTGAGVWGENLDGSYFGVYSNGELGASGLKSFMIDHPADPANKYLKHFSMESDEVLNVYRGNIILDNSGEALVTLPTYFQSVNRNFSYHLTAIGSAAPGLFVKEEVQGNNSFKIAGGNPGQKVSWMLQAERNDPYLQHYPEKRLTEVNKRPGEKGTYLRPEIYGQPASKGVNAHIQSKPLNELR